MMIAFFCSCNSCFWLVIPALNEREERRKREEASSDWREDMQPTDSQTDIGIIIMRMIVIFSPLFHHHNHNHRMMGSSLFTSRWYMAGFLPPFYNSFLHPSFPNHDGVSTSDRRTATENVARITWWWYKWKTFSHLFFLLFIICPQTFRFHHHVSPYLFFFFLNSDKRRRYHMICCWRKADSCFRRKHYMDQNIYIYVFSSGAQEFSYPLICIRFLLVFSLRNIFHIFRSPHDHLEANPPFPESTWLKWDFKRKSTSFPSSRYPFECNQQIERKEEVKFLR